MRIAVQGCSHGELEKIYESIVQSERETGQKVDLLICCGDFQACRNEYDMRSMKIPKKHARIASFWRYYCGEAVAPCLTLVIGGNHEASNYMWELYYGGWLAPNIYYLGSAGVVNVGGLRIGGISGIYKKFDYHKGHHETPPLSGPEIVSIFHVRSLEVMRCKSIQQPMDIFLSHDWPIGVYDYGDKEQLIRCKPFFEEEIAANELGSPPAAEIMESLQPAYWFSGHLHVKFSAVIPHDEFGKSTRFLALDKCLPRRRFLQIVDIGKQLCTPPVLEYDAEWLTILRKTASYYNPLNIDQRLPQSRPVEESEVATTIETFGSLIIPENFSITVPVYGEKVAESRYNPSANPQSAVFCKKLGIKNETVPDGCKAADIPEDLDISHDSDANMTREPITERSIVGIEEISKPDKPEEEASDIAMLKEFSAPELKTPSRAAPEKKRAITSTPVNIKRRLTLPAPRNNTVSPIKSEETPSAPPVKLSPSIPLPEIKREEVDQDNVSSEPLPPGLAPMDTQPDPLEEEKKEDESAGKKEDETMDDFDLDESDDNLISKFLSLKKKFGRSEVLSDSLLVNTSMKEVIGEEMEKKIEEDVEEEGQNKKFKMEIHNDLDS